MSVRGLGGRSGAPPLAPLSPEQRRCGSLCAHTDSIACAPVSLCEHGCLKMLTAGVCSSQVRRFFDCAEREPVKSWECNNGTPALKNGVCDREQAEFFACFKSAAMSR